MLPTAMPTVASRSDSGTKPNNLRGRSRRRQLESEPRSVPGLGIDLDLAVVTGHDPLDRRKAEPDAGLTARAAAEEWLEKTTADLGRNARPGVLDLDPHALAAVDRAHGNVAGQAVPHVLDGI